MALTAIPVLRTERLTLRKHRLDDFEAIAAMWSDPEVTRHISGKPRPEEEAWMKFLRDAGHWALLGYGYWIATETASGAVIGQIGFADFKRDLSPSIKGEPELGYAFATAFHGKGYASEAARAVVAWGDAHFGAGQRMSCIVGVENAGSIRVAEKCGFQETGRSTYHGDDIVVLHRDIP